MPESLPPPPDPSPTPTALPSWSALARSWLVGVDGAVSLRRLGAMAGGALAVVVVAVVAWRALVAGGTGASGPPPELTMPRAGVGDGGPTSTTGEDVGSPGASSTIVVAHVAGAVVRPGLYRLGGTPRIADAVDAAGGPAPDAQLDAVNLAAPVADGERVYVPREGESPPAVAGGGAGAPAAGPLDLNTATAEQLEALPGVGPATATAIVSYRQERGRFRSVDELLEVRGIGEAKLAELRPKVRVR